MAKNSNNVLAIGVGLNLDPLNNDIQQAASTAKSGMDTIGSAIVGSSSKSGTATKDLGDKVQSLRSQLRQATQDTQQMAEKFGVMSQQAIASAARAGELKDQIGDINTVITAFSADSKFTVVAGALQQAAGAASIVTGAMGLLGTESKATQEMLLKVQSALALTQGLASIKEMGASFTALRAVIVGQVIPSITAMNTTMMLGIGGAIVAIGALTLAVYKYTESLNKEYEAQLRVNQAELNNIKNRNAIKGIIEETAVMQNEALKTSLNQELAANDLSLKAELKKNNEKFNSLRNTGIDMSKLLYQEVAQQQAIEEKFQKQAQEIRDKYSKQELKQAQENALKKRQYQASNVMQSITGRIEFAGFGNAPIEPKLPNLTPPNYIKEQYTKLSDEMLKAKILLIKTNEQIWNDLKINTQNGIANTFGSIGQAIGSSIADSMSGQDTDMMDAIGVAIVKSLGAMAAQIGTTLIAMSVPLILAQVPIGYAYAAAGTALIAIGTATQSLAGKKSTSSPQNTSVAQSSYSQGNNMSSNFLPTQGNTIVINGMIKGNDIQLVNGRNDKKFNRNFNFG